MEGAPKVTVVDGNINTDDFTVEFSEGNVELAGIPDGERNELHLTCEILDVITFTWWGGWASRAQLR